MFQTMFHLGFFYPKLFHLFRLGGKKKLKTSVKGRLRSSCCSVYVPRSECGDGLSLLQVLDCVRQRQIPADWGKMCFSLDGFAPKRCGGWMKNDLRVLLSGSTIRITLIVLYNKTCTSVSDTADMRQIRHLKGTYVENPLF